ncbi:maleylpyruvate isomerase family mycothiol-dependent enzyme [Jatrophihabitans telluris]|uniref:Maleylpyruvate isomerase family mycothiol-dependent enzyme n=1 Tax=Jatrophihabitans telluris TaxID=2038343 RepID=A0ABY4R0R8_9ACTN|nr:maleylpyruvate isomerase family mycothiol-dependent enzyme [Jatrophihabitans telluris]UQX89305.1 maleylpyruvate isomerase family mycothiol-dependent enzyme [Jatrophihabitans telluris]
MTESIWSTIHAERRSLAEDVADLDTTAWQTRSLCADWTVHDVLAHLLSLAKMTPPRFAVRMAQARFRFNTFTANQVELERVGGPAGTLTAFREATPRTNAPPGPKETWLGEAFVHGEDIRRPLGIAHDYPLPMVARTIAFYAGSNAIIGGRDRVADLTLQATDTDCTVGTGPLVQGPAMSLLLAASGRPCTLDDLNGPGVDMLRARF